MNATRFMRRPLFCIGYQVTVENMDEVAEWCDGIITTDERGQDYIRVPVMRATSVRQTQAYIGLWVTMTIHLEQKSFKVYQPKWLEQDWFDVTDTIKVYNGFDIPDEVEVDTLQVAFSDPPAAPTPNDIAAFKNRRLAKASNT
jgi:hypothetical protein